MRTGVLLTAFGGPRNLDEVVPFMRSLMGREPSDAVVVASTRKYLTIGGFSPLPFTAERIASNLERELSGLERLDVDDSEGIGMLGLPPAVPRATGGVKMPVAVGMRYTEPSIRSAVDELAAQGVREIVTVSLTPFDAAVTTGAYREAVAEAVAAHPGLRVVEGAAYNRSDAFVGALADGVVGALDEAGEGGRRTLVVFTAHSLPVADVEKDPAYVDQLRETVAAVAAAAGLGAPGEQAALPGVDAFGGGADAAPWLLAYQSRGASGGEWLGPGLEDVIAAASDAGFQAVAVAPVGFAIDHMETLYDLDVVAADQVLEAGMEFSRAKLPNDAPAMIEALARSVRAVI